VQLIEWTPVNTAGNEIDIFPNINNPNNLWRTRQHRFTFIDNPAPLVDAAYHLEVTDVFGKSATYTTPNIIRAISTKAIPTVQEYVNNNWNDAGKQPQGEALYKVRFKHDKVTNATNYTWKGFANSRQTNGDKTVVWTESTTNANAEIPPQMPYNGKSYDGYTPGSYQVRLIVRNNVCTDSVAIPIVVDPSAFDVESIPNAFTPNDDGRNDVFTFVSGHEPISMEYIYVYIYSRSGGLVYRYEGRSDEWEGWNGRMMGTGSDVSEGVYYYVISGRGWDDINYNTKEYSGYLHLFR
jgi:gliding motility-associated-like protein